MASGIDAFIREKFQCELIWKAELPNTAGGHIPVWHQYVIATDFLIAQVCQEDPMPAVLICLVLCAAFHRALFENQSLRILICFCRLA